MSCVSYCEIQTNPNMFGYTTNRDPRLQSERCKVVCTRKGRVCNKPVRFSDDKWIVPVVVRVVRPEFVQTRRPPQPPRATKGEGSVASGGGPTTEGTRGLLYTMAHSPLAIAFGATSSNPCGSRMISGARLLWFVWCGQSLCRLAGRRSRRERQRAKEAWQAAAGQQPRAREAFYILWHIHRWPLRLGPPRGPGGDRGLGFYVQKKGVVWVVYCWTIDSSAAKHRGIEELEAGQIQCRGNALTIGLGWAARFWLLGFGWLGFVWLLGCLVSVARFWLARFCLVAWCVGLVTTPAGHWWCASCVARQERPQPSPPERGGKPRHIRTPPSLRLSHAHLPAPLPAPPGTSHPPHP